MQVDQYRHTTSRISYRYLLSNRLRCVPVSCDSRIRPQASALSRNSDLHPTCDDILGMSSTRLAAVLSTHPLSQNDLKDILFLYSTRSAS